MNEVAPQHQEFTNYADAQHSRQPILESCQELILIKKQIQHAVQQDFFEKDFINQ